jgi:hypothetical protein
LNKEFYKKVYSIMSALYLLLGLEDLALGRLLLSGLYAVEESIIDVGRHLDLADVELGAGGNDVSLIDASQRATVQLVWARDQQKARVQLLQEDNALFFKKKDKSSTR